MPWIHLWMMWIPYTLDMSVDALNTSADTVNTLDTTTDAVDLPIDAVDALNTSTSTNVSEGVPTMFECKKFEQV